MERKKVTLQEAYNKWAETRRDRDWTPVYNKLIPMLNFYLVKWIPCEDTRSMIISNAMEKIWTKIDSYTPEYQFSTWCFAILTNETRINWRKSSKLKVGSVEEIKEISGWEPIYEEDEQFDDSLYQSALDSIKSLDGDMGRALYLREVKQMKYKEIAEEMNAPMNTIKIWIRRGRERVKQKIT